MPTLFSDIPPDATISDIQPLARDPNLRRVRVGRTTVATLRASDVESLRLAAGQPWTSELAQRVAELIAVNKARKQAMTMLGRRPYSRGELIERLVRKGHEVEIAQHAADELVTDGWIDDRAYAESILHELTHRKPASKRLMMAKLQARRIDPELAEQVVEESLAEVDPMQAALDLARQRFATMRRVSPATARRRLAGLLGRRGFDEQVIEVVLERLGLTAEES